MLPERKRVFEIRCKGTHYFRNFQTFSFFFHIFGFAESTFVRKTSNKFGFSLTYSYLCRQINNYGD